MAKKQLTPEKKYNSGFIDITKMGPLNYRDLRAMNNNLPEESKASQQIDFNPLNGGFSGADISYTGIEGNPNNFGDSTYDPQLATQAEFNDIKNIRADEQGVLAKLGAGLGKAVTTAGTTLVDGTAGLIYGAAEAIKTGVNGGSASEAWSKLFDNDISNNLQKFNDEMEKILPNYRTDEEDERAWYQNVGTANFWADFIKQIGFTVGAAYSGGAWNKALKALGVLKNAGSARFIGSTISALNEGRIEANNNSNDWEKLQMGQLDDSYQKRYQELAALGDTEGLAQLEQNYQNEVASIQERKNVMGITDMALNMPVLMWDNLKFFGKMYGKGFADVEKTARKNVIKQGDKYAVKHASTWNKIGEGLNTSRREGMEEMTQMMAAESAGSWQEYKDGPDAYYKALTNLTSQRETKDFVQGLVEGFSNSYGDLDKYQDFVMGALTGLLGSPTFGKTSNSSSDTFLGRGKMVGLTGGIGAAFSSASENEANAQKAVDEMNAYMDKYGKNTKERLNHMSANNFFNNAMDGFAAESNSFEYHNAQDNEEFSAIDAFASTGHLQDYKDMVNQSFENISDEDLYDIAEKTKDSETGKYTWANPDGTSMASTEDGRKQMKDKLIKRRDDILKQVDSYEKALADMRAFTKIEDNDDAIRELAWLKWKSGRFRDRAASVLEDNKDNFTNIQKALKTKLGTLGWEIQKYNHTNPEDLTQGQKDSIDAIRKTHEALTMISQLVEQWQQGIPVAVSDKAAEAIKDKALYDVIASNSGMSYDEYQNTLNAINDVKRIQGLKKQFDDKLKEYLEVADTQVPAQSKKATAQVTTAQATTTTQAVADEDIVPMTEEEAEGATSTITISGTEQKLNEEHQKRDEQVADDNAIQSVAELNAKADAIKTVNDYTKNKGKDRENIDKAIDEIAKTNPNHPAVIARKFTNFANSVGEKLSEFDYKKYNVPENIGQIAAQSFFNALGRITSLDLNELFKGHSFNEFLDSISTEGFSAKDIIDDVANESGLDASYIEGAVENFMVGVNDILQQSTKEVKEAEKISHTPTATEEQTTTGADDNPSNPGIGSTTEEKKEEPVENAQSFIAKAVTNGLSDNQVIDGLVNKGITKEEAKAQLDTFKENNKPITEEEAAITIEATSEIEGTVEDAAISAINTKKNAGDYTNKGNDADNEPLPKEGRKYNYLRPATTEFPIHQTDEEMEGTFNYNAWVDAQSYPQEEKDQLKKRHARQEQGYKMANHGQIKDRRSKNPTTINFAVFAADNSENDFVIYLTDENGVVIGDLPMEKYASNYNGLNDLYAFIKDEYSKAGSPESFVSSLTSHVDKIMLGRPQFIVDENTVGSITPMPVLAICKNGTTGSFITGAKSDSSNIKDNEIHSPLAPKSGQVYLLLPNGRAGKDNGYSAILCETLPISKIDANSQYMQELNKAVEKFANSTSFHDILNNFKALSQFVNFGKHDKITINMFNGKQLVTSKNAASNTITSIVIKSDGQKLTEIPIGDSAKAAEIFTKLLEAVDAHPNVKSTQLKSGIYNDIVTTNLPVNTETTVNNWFTINPVIKQEDGTMKEVSANSPKSTKTNPNAVDNSVIRESSGVVRVPSKNIIIYPPLKKVYLNGKIIIAANPNDPSHLSNGANKLLAWNHYAINKGSIEVKNNVVATPYGNYDIKQKKLVASAPTVANEEFEAVTQEEATGAKPLFSLGGTNDNSSTPTNTGNLSLSLGSGSKSELNKNEPNSIEKRIIIDSSTGTGMTQVFGYKPKSNDKDTRATEFVKKRRDDSRIVKNPKTGNTRENFYVEFKDGTSMITQYSDKNHKVFGRKDGTGITIWRKLTPTEVKKIQDALWEGNFKTFNEMAEFVDKVMHEEDTTPNNQTEVKQEEKVEAPIANPNALATAEIEGKQIEITKKDLRKMKALGFGTNLKSSSSQEEIISAYKEYKEALENGSARTVDSTPVTKFDKEKELKWLSKVLPQFTSEERVTLVDGLIDNRAWGMFMDGIIYLSNDAAEGTTYHEAFHAVTQTILSEKEKNSLYNTASQVYKNSNRKEIEENLAEDFRRFTQMNLEPKTGLKGFFEKIARFVKYLYSNRGKLEYLFYKINQGKFADRAIASRQNTANDVAYRELTTVEDYQSVLDSWVNNPTLFNAKQNDARMSKLGSMLDSWKANGYVVEWKKKGRKIVVTNVTKANDTYSRVTDRAISNSSRAERFAYNNLTQGQLDYLHNSGSHSLTREQYEQLTTAEREQYFECMGI